ncbi:hypothetical protein [Massilia sp. ST3]|uniref:hypothetical protein n=1 Tax=Massilia sp. ST3 TaxID=2824903 RepID=UPI001B82A6A8|nr:hypothetical protein [Massilia sp. ST3]MBQ5947822.1 hypothetical protein [Massilia sp. ST3]
MRVLRSAFVLLLCLWLPAAASDHGLRALRIAQADTPRIDGTLDDPAWQGAPVYDNFHKHQPRDGNPPASTLRTTVQLLIDEHALVFAIRAWDTAPAALRGSLARRDKVGLEQDFIGVWIDPVGHGRAAQFVRINTAGVVSDGVYRADDDESDLGPDFPIETAVKPLPDGYSMEVRWPLSSLRFPYAGGRAWQLLVERSVPHAGGTLLLTAPLKTDALNQLAFLREIEGMGATVETVRDRRFVELRPELTLRAARDGVDGRRERGLRLEAGLEVNLRPRADWVFNGILNPDYSQIEVDQPVSAGASNIALSLPEKRGFFLESSDVLGLPLPAFYSRTVFDPQWGARATWRASHLDATAMSLRDEPGGLVLRGRPYATLEYVQPRRSTASLWRTRWHGDGLLLGAFVSQRDYHAFGRNDVLGLDGQWRGEDAEGAQRQAAFVAMHSRTTAGFDASEALARTPRREGGYLWTKFVHSSSDWWNEAVVEAIGPGFVNDNGFLPQAGIARLQLDLNRILGRQEALGLHEFEAHLGLHEIRTLGDRSGGQPGNEVVTREIRPGFWLAAPGQTRFWTQLGFDRQRARQGGRLHRTPALHAGVETVPLPWVSKIAAEVALGRQLDADADRVGPGGNVILDVGLRFPLPRGWALELDHHVNRAWVRGTLGQDAFSDTAWRWLAMLHFSPRDSLRVLAQNTWAARRDDGITQLEAWSDRQIHRSVLYRYRWRHGRTVSAGYVDDRMPLARSSTRALTVQWQWEI